MTVKELIDELQKVPQDLNVLVGGETAQKVIVEECEGNKYVHIFEPWDMNLVLGSAGLHFPGDEKVESIDTDWLNDNKIMTLKERQEQKE